MKIEYFPAESGCLTARVLGGNFERLLHSAISPEQERNFYRPKSFGEVVFAFGIGLGYHLEFLRDLPQGTISLVVLCDAFAENLEIVKKKLEGLSIFVVGEPQNAFPVIKDKRITVIRHPAASRYCEKEGENGIRKILGENTPHSTPHTLYSTPKVALPFGSHFLQQEILNALKDLEIPAIKLPQENNNPNELEEILMLKFWENRPSLVLSVNGKGIDSEGILINVCKRFSVSLHIWFVDDPRPIVCLYSKSQCENITVWTWEKAYIPYLKEKNFYRVAYLPLAGDPHLFYPSKINTPLQHNLVFTGSAMASSFLDEIWRHITYNKTEVLPIAENAAFQILTGAMTADQMPGETKEESWFSSLAIHTASREKRRLCLEPLLPLGLQFAGDPKGWRELFGNNIKTLPDIDYRTNLREHYSKGNIHINITSCQMPNAVNQRVFDIPLCGRFVISDNQNDLFELFSSDAICAAATPEEYADLAKFHIANPNAKNEIVKKAQECIINNHTYKHRLSVILQADSKI